jgi:hypothetical protein
MNIREMIELLRRATFLNLKIGVIGGAGFALMSAALFIWFNQIIGFKPPGGDPFILLIAGASAVVVWFKYGTLDDMYNLPAYSKSVYDGIVVFIKDKDKGAQ